MIKPKFYDLQLPKNEHTISGSIWYVRVKRNDLSYYLLNDGSFKLDDLDVIPAQRFHFKTEHDAHHHACEYHTKHGVAYPYFPEFHKSQRGKVPRAPTAIVDDNGSQVMIFK